MQTRKLPRPVYPTDKVIDSNTFLTNHPFHNPVFHTGSTIQSVRVTWPLPRGGEETMDYINIPRTTPGFEFMEQVDDATFQMYMWDKSRATAYDRGMFNYVNDSSGFFHMRRVPPDSVHSQAQRVADEVFRSISTGRAVECAISCKTDSESEMDESDTSETSSNTPSLFSVQKYNGYSRPTTYKGVDFRSLTEARFALVLDELQIPYQYESITFNRPGGSRYMPDFFLPDQQLMIEIKPAYPLVEEEQKCEEMSAAGFRIVCMYGERIGVLPLGYEQKKRNYAHKDGMRGIAWHRGEKLGGVVTFVVGAAPNGSMLEMGNTDAPHLDLVRSTKDRRWDSPIIRAALEKAGLQN